MRIFSFQIPSKAESSFGSVMQTRIWSASTYRYGFNGKEKDDEGLGGGQSTYDYGFRIYNPALGKFLSVDPLIKDYPWYTPYQFAGNSPISAKDLDGMEPLCMVDKTGKLTAPVIAFLSTAFDWDSKRMEMITVTRKNSVRDSRVVDRIPVGYWMKTTGKKSMNSNAEAKSSYAGWLSCIAHEMEHLNLMNDYPMGMVANFLTLDFLYKSHDNQTNEIDAEKTEKQVADFMEYAGLRTILNAPTLTTQDKVNVMTIMGFNFKIEQNESRLSSLQSQLESHQKIYDGLKSSSSTSSEEYYSKNIAPLQNSINATKTEIESTKKELGQFIDTLK